ncbi:MAG: hypothetical protein E6Q85_09505 [Thiothrix sp.]|nr:MAG: hypothetical protein E6Q85_09505 [Thiothrix sp.]
MHQQSNEAKGVNSRPNRLPTLSREQINFALDVTAEHLPTVVNVLVKLMAFSALFWAVLKVFLVADKAGVLYALLFSGMHLPFCLFSVLFVLWFFDEYQSMGYFALFSAVINALLI